VSFLPEPLKIPAFRYYWLARLVTTIGQMAMVIVIGWQVYDIARRTMSIGDAAFQLGMIGLVQFVPLFLLTPVSGWVADRLDRRHVARAVVILEMLCAMILFVATWSHRINLPILFGVAALLGVARAFAGPALGALAPNLVPRELLPRAIALSSTAWQAGAIAGPNLTHFAADTHTCFAGCNWDTSDTEALKAWLRDPNAVKLGAKMPNYHLSDEEIDALVAYLHTLT
jgi:MFS family permease